MRQRSFEIIRKPDLEDSSFLFNNVKVRYVATCPETGISFYINNGQGGVIGVRVYPDGRKVFVNAGRIDWPGKHGKAVYMHFQNAFGHCKAINASHAVYMAWRKKEIPAGMTIDHIDGCSTNNYIANLRCVSNAINKRDGGFLCKLRNKGFDTTTIQRPYILRYFDRMAILQLAITRWRYRCLDKEDIEILLYYTNQAASVKLNMKYNLKLNLQSCPTTLQNCAD